MFTLPSRPPRDYKLEDVTETQASAPELTPLAYPRATQTSVAKYCTPIPADDKDPLDSIQAEPYNELILNKFINKARADWVDRPESDGFFIHDMCKKYRVDVIPEVDVRFQYHPQIFNRPYMYELDCMEYVRLQKLYDKTRREEDADKNMLERLASLKRKQEAKELVKNPCKKYPPRWWKEPVPEEEWLEFDSKPSQSVYQASYHRWQPVPEISRETDPIKGRYAFAKIVTENLFLLEFLVDSVEMTQYGSRNIGDNGSTCVSVQFLDNPPLDICEDNFLSKRKYDCESDNVKNGKSCLFSLTPAKAVEALHDFDVTVNVYKKLQPGLVPDQIELGSSVISIVNLFNRIIVAVSAVCHTITPAVKTLKDVFQIKNALGEYVGDIGMYIRMSCFGKLIVTQFQMNLEDKSVLFKDKEGQSLYRYKKAGQDTSRMSVQGHSNSCSSCSPVVPCCATKTSCSCSKCSQSPCSHTSQEQGTTIFNSPCGTCALVPACCTPRKSCFQEFGASLGPNSLTIRVHKKKKCEPVPCEPVPCDESCTCIPSCCQFTQQSCPRACGGGCCPQEQCMVMRPGCEDDRTSNVPFSFKLGGCALGCCGTGCCGTGCCGTQCCGTQCCATPCCGTGCCQNNVTVCPPICTTCDGTQYTELSDPKKDVFILRIGKKSEGCCEKKNNIELELCTPKGPDIKPPPRMEDRDMQCEEEESSKKGDYKEEEEEEEEGGGRQLCRQRCLWWSSYSLYWRMFTESYLCNILSSDCVHVQFLWIRPLQLLFALRFRLPILVLIFCILPLR
ncbi:hypothetical protein FQA39_LY13522 [Lamprigera yunnana]|nr:hypothetical protein FQA39_LY13522 [Lamprigera yunnana]